MDERTRKTDQPPLADPMQDPTEHENDKGADCAGRRPRRFGRGIYEKTDTPIRLLDGFIAGLIGVIVIMVVIFALTGGYTVTFDAAGGTDTASQKLRHGNLVAEPEEPVRQGYRFTGWYSEKDADRAWDFALDKVEGDMTLTAGWEPAKVLVRFDPAGGELSDGADGIEVTYQGPYGALPLPQKEGSRFAGWVYSGETITPESIVMMPGEHVLTAMWE